MADAEQSKFDSGWLSRLESRKHFLWYYYQAKLVFDELSRDDRILEIGVGTSLLSDLLKRRKWQISNIDIDPEKNPDICVNALEFDFQAAGVSTVLAFEVFEHIPYADFETLIGNITGSGADTVLFSLPWNKFRLLDIDLDMPLVGPRSLFIGLNRRKIFTKNHFWELSGKRIFLKNSPQGVSAERRSRHYRETITYTATKKREF